MLKVHHGNINANKEPLFLKSVKAVPLKVLIGQSHR